MISALTPNLSLIATMYFKILTSLLSILTIRTQSATLMAGFLDLNLVSN